MTQYPGPDGDDPFSRPPKESGASEPAGTPPPSPVGTPPTEETAPIRPEEVGYWEKRAEEDQARLRQQADQQAQSSNPWGDQPGSQPGTPYVSPYGQPSYGQPAYGQPAYRQPGYSGYPAAPPNHPSATTALVLGLISLIGGCLCGLPLLVSPFAWATGARAKREIDASNGQLGGGGNAQAGYVMGIIGTVLLVLGVVVVVGLVVIGLVGSSSTSTSTTF